MAIQNRRGAYADFDPAKMVAGEFAVVQTGDPGAEDGKAVYMAFSSGSVKRLATYEDMQQSIVDATGDIVQDIEAGIADDVSTAQQAAQQAQKAAASLVVDTGLDMAGAAADSAATGDLAKDLVAPAYSTSSTYAIGDLVTYAKKLYRCTTAISTAEAWTAAHWTAVTVSGEFGNRDMAIADVKDDLKETLEYNCYDAISLVPKTDRVHNGITYTWEGNSCAITGTASSTSVCPIYYNISALPSLIKPGENYRVFFAGENVSLKIWFYKNNTYSSGYTIFNNKDITIPSDADGLVIRLQVESDKTVNERVTVGILNSYTNKELYGLISSNDNETDDLKYEDSVELNINNSNWVNGYINTLTGELVVSQTAITTDFYVSGICTVKVDNGKSIAYSKYEQDGTFLNRSNWLTSDVDLNPDFKYKISMRTEPYSSGYNTDINEYGKCQIIEKISFDGYKVKRLAGKKVSILGDSISTFAGYIPVTNVAYYPTSRCPDMNSVSQTWWNRVITSLGMELLIDNSYSGGRVAVAGDSAGRAIIRCDALDDGVNTPDIIFFFMGTNDFNTNVTIGSYDGTDSFPTSSDTTFRASYAQVLKKMMEKYPLADVYCFTILACERMGETGFPEKNDRGTLNQYNDAIRDLANLFNCKIINTDKCGITYFNISKYMGDYNYPSEGQGLHPNGDGHKLIAEQVIRSLI